MDELNKKIGIKIRILREKANEYQKETALAITKLGVNLTEGQLGTYENGSRKVPPIIANALAKHFNTTTDFIFCNTDKPEKEVITEPKKNIPAYAMYHKYKKLPPEAQKDVDNFFEFLESKFGKEK